MSNYEQFEAVFERVVKSLPENTSIKQDMTSLPVFERSVLAVGWYIQQVLNGGHAQWVGNGYNNTSHQLLFALECLEHLRPEVSIKVRALACRALDMGEEPPEDDEHNVWYNAMNGLDDQFYALEPELCEVVAQFFCSDTKPVMGWTAVG